MSTLTIKQELTQLRSAVISLIGEDPEGVYRPEFVAETLAALAHKPEFTFSTPEKFLRHLKRT